MTRGTDRGRLAGSSWGRPPEQARSARTAGRILDSAQQLLDKNDFDDLSVPQIVANAGCSVGAFYGRFRDKEGLLEALDERYVEVFAEQIERTWEKAGQKKAPLDEIVHDTIAELVAFHRTNRGLVRTLISRARRKPDSGYRRREERLNALVPRFVDLVLSEQYHLAQDNVPSAVSLGMLMLLFTIREFVLWDHLARIVPLSDEALIDELTRAFLKCVGFTQRAERGKKRRS